MPHYVLLLIGRFLLEYFSVERVFSQHNPSVLTSSSTFKRCQKTRCSFPMLCAELSMLYVPARLLVKSMRWFVLASPRPLWWFHESLPSVIYIRCWLYPRTDPCCIWSAFYPSWIEYLNEHDKVCTLDRAIRLDNNGDGIYTVEYIQK